MKTTIWHSVVVNDPKRDEETYDGVTVAGVPAGLKRLAVQAGHTPRAPLVNPHT